MHSLSWLNHRSSGAPYLQPLTEQYRAQQAACSSCTEPETLQAQQEPSAKQHTAGPSPGSSAYPYDGAWPGTMTESSTAPHASPAASPTSPTASVPHPTAPPTALTDPPSRSAAGPLPPAGTAATTQSDLQLLLAACLGSYSGSSVEALHAAFLAAIRLAEQLVKHEVENAAKLVRRVRSDLNFLERCLAATPADSAAPTPTTEAGACEQQPQSLQTVSQAEATTAVPHQPPSNSDQPPATDSTVGQQTTARPKVSRLSKVLTPERVQGLANNLRGYAGEILTAQLAPGVVAVGKRFHAIPCQTTPAPGAAHEHMVAARRQRLNDKKDEQRAREKAATMLQPPESDARTLRLPPTSGAAAGAGCSAGTGAVQRPGGNTPPHVNKTGPDAADTCHPLPPQTDTCDPAPVSAYTVTQSSREAAGGQAGSVEPARKRSSPTEAASGTQGEAAGLCDLTLSVEVDVVCGCGSVWVEVKAQEPFGLDSEHWAANRPRSKGLRRQIQELLFVAGQPCNHVRWQPPQVVVLFPSGADPGVVQALENMGALAVVGMDDLATALPPRPPAPTVTNLDTTTMCSLVSEASWAPPGDEGVARWAARTVQWRDCVQQQAEDPILPLLAPYLEPGRRLIAADQAVNQFEILVSQFGGPKEKQRWSELKQRLDVVSTQVTDDDGNGSNSNSNSNGNSNSNSNSNSNGNSNSNSNSNSNGNVSSRMTTLGSLREIGAQQIAVFGVGDAHRAVTLTANGSAVRSASRQGVSLESVVHRAVWLTGL